MGFAIINQSSPGERVQMFDIGDPKDIRVALLAGGTSGEREISLASGKGARKALEQAGFQADQFDPANAEDLKALIDGDYDVAFLCTHGRGGEDGALQGFLETIKLPYVGSDVRASALAMHKGEAKHAYARAEIRTPDALSLHQGEQYDVDQIIAQVGDHCAVKAITEGSTLGLYIVEGRDALSQALVDVFDHDTEALIERFVSGRELTVAVIGTGAAAKALPIIEIIPKNAFYDFESKYAPGGSQHICPAELSDQVTEKVQTLAVAAHNALGCSGVSRSDFILEPDGTAWILETNTLPGMTETSLLPDAARAAGVEFPDLCTMLIADALERAATR